MAPRLLVTRRVPNRRKPKHARCTTVAYGTLVSGVLARPLAGMVTGRVKFGVAAATSLIVETKMRIATSQQHMLHAARILVAGGLLVNGVLAVLNVARVSSIGPWNAKVGRMVLDRQVAQTKARRQEGNGALGLVTALRVADGRSTLGVIAVRIVGVASGREQFLARTVICQIAKEWVVVLRSRRTATT